MSTLIAVPSYNRAEHMFKYLTLKQLTNAGFKPLLFIRASECEKYAPVCEHYGIEYVAVGEIPIDQKRDAIVQYAHDNNYDRVFMLDDDLRFAWRKTVWDRLQLSGPEQIRAMVAELEELCDPVAPMVGCRLRAFANNAQEPYSIATRIIFNVMLHVPSVMYHGWKYTCPFRGKEDLNFHLQVLTSGYRTITSNLFTCDSGLDKEDQGGCGTWRTTEVMTQCSELLKRQWPEFVTLREKVSNYGEVYQDVTIRYKKAYEYGCKHRGVDCAY